MIRCCKGPSFEQSLKVGQGMYLKPNTIPMVLNPFVASGNFDQKERLPKNGLFGSATGSGLLSIRWTWLSG